jgi:hypothetical protein
MISVMLAKIVRPHTCWAEFRHELSRGAVCSGNSRGGFVSFGTASGKSFAPMGSFHKSLILPFCSSLPALEYSFLSMMTVSTFERMLPSLLLVKSCAALSSGPRRSTGASFTPSSLLGLSLSL